MQDYYDCSLDRQPRAPQGDYVFREPFTVPSSSRLEEERRDHLRLPADFRKKKNWSERILVEITGLILVLSVNGDILYCSESAIELTGYKPYQLVGQKLMEYLHVDDMDVFIRDFQMSFHTRSQIRSYYRFRKTDDSYTIFEVIGQPNNGTADRPSQAFFGIAQPVPSKSCSMIDSFLELKTENDWLRKRVKELSAKYGRVSIDRVEQEAVLLEDTVDSLYVANNLQSTSQTGSRHMMEEQEAWQNTSAVKVETIASISNESSLAEDMYDRKDKWKRRKTKGTDEYVCKDCGTTSSPEWRKGPQGAKTLCNACGLRWAKKNKRKNFNEN
ncbi:hypothetical protein BY458DRAFT_556396 [Sporodiniella umbellata]|nr:hypothetical protein BY458DRAFT_556396 [Sporodiniella umbellata]